MPRKSTTPTVKVPTLVITAKGRDAFRAIKRADSTTAAACLRFWQAVGAVDASEAWLPDSPAAKVSVRRLALAIVDADTPDLAKDANGARYVGHEGNNPSAAVLAAMPSGEAAYWRTVAATAARLTRAADGIRPVVKRATKAPKPKAKGVTPPAAPTGPVTYAVPDVSNVTSVLQALAKREDVPGITRDGGNAILAAAQALAPAPVVKPADLGPDVLAQAIALLITSDYRSDALLTVCQEYVRKYAPAKVTRARRVPALASA